MQRRIRPNLLRENNYGTNYPAPQEKTLDITSLNGGLNLWDLDYRLDANQSPDLLNVCWKDGSLSSRKGQAYISSSVEYGKFYACYERSWPSNTTNIIAHKGTKLYKIDCETGVHTELTGVTLTECYGGTFFVFGDKLYYMNGHEYVVVDNKLKASDVEGYIPTVIINRYHDGTGGSLYQDENRIQAGKKIQFTTGKIDGDTELPKTYNIPSGYCPMDGDAVICKLTSPSVIEYKEVQTVSARPEKVYKNIAYKIGDAYYELVDDEWTTVSAPSNTFTVDRTTGVITFETAPPHHLTQTPSNLDVTFYKENALAKDNIYSCRCATVYGGDTELAVVVGGPTSLGEDGSKVANAYFWSGSTNVGLDPTYFPFDYYNYAGANSDEPIVAFGRQQKMLVIFKENSIGKTYFDVDDEDAVLNLPYTPLNETIGCDIEKSVKLIQNNLVFANTYGGVYVLLDTSSAGENIVKRISRNVNGENVYKASKAVVNEYSGRSLFPTTGEIGVYYRDSQTGIEYTWNSDSGEYVVSRVAAPSSGLMYDLSSKRGSSSLITSFDDGQRYWICANGKAYIWDYTLSSINSYEKNMCWFYFDNINPRGWFKTIDGIYYGMCNGEIAHFVDSFNDFGNPIPRRYTFATQNFGTYEVLKDVLKVIFSVRSDTDTTMTITYRTDYEQRTDKTPIRAYSWRLAPRDLTHRSLRVIPFAGTAIRKPRCFHVRHFKMQLENSTVNTDMSVVSAQIVYRFSRGDR